MLIFGGWGSVAAMVAGLAWLGLSQKLFGDGRIFGFFVLMFGVALAAFGQFLHSTDVSVEVDPTTGGDRLIRHRHHLFWISLRWWGLLLVCLGLSAVVRGGG